MPGERGREIPIPDSPGTTDKLLPTPSKAMTALSLHLALLMEVMGVGDSFLFKKQNNPN